jgi:hypothetical protein
MLIQKIIHASVRALHSALEIVEIALAGVIFLGVMYFALNAGQSFLLRDWSSMSVMYEFISFILLVLLGLEVARLILVHSFSVVMELMLLIIARKMLYPDISALDLLFCTVAFAVVVGAYYLYELKPIKSLEDLTT